MSDNLEKLHALAERLTDIEFELTRANAFLAAIVNSSYEAILAKDFDGILTSWNPAAERIYGYSSEEAIGQHISLIVPNDKLNELNKIMAQVQKGEAVKIETDRIRKDGKRIHINLTVSPIKSSVGEIVGASAIARPAEWKWDENV